MVELQEFAQVRRPASIPSTFLLNSPQDRCRPSVLPWIISFVIVAVVAVACRFAEDHPRSDDPPDSSDEDPVTVLLAA